MELIEYGPPVKLDIDQSKALEIIRSSELWQRRLKLKSPPFRLTPTSDHQFNFEARGIAGFIRIGDLTLEIAPKFLNHETIGPNWRSAMWRFLSYGRGIQALSQTSGIMGFEAGIADILADMFLASLNGASVRGYPLGYRSRRVDSAFVSGRLDPKKFSKLLPVTGKIGIIADRLTQDIPTNRLLKWAGLELSKSVESPARRKRLEVWSTELPNVSPIPPRIEQVPSPKQQFPHLAHDVEIARLLFDDREATFGAGDFDLPGFLWDSDDLFERATRRLLSEAVRPLGFNVSKRRHVLAKTILDGSETYTYTTPDIDIWSGKCSVFILDSKYKILDQKPSNEDFYQVLAAGRVREVPEVALIYPSSGTGVMNFIFEPQGSGFPKIVHVTKIGLESFASRKQVATLQNEILKWIESATSPPIP